MEKEDSNGNKSIQQLNLQADNISNTGILI